MINTQCGIYKITSPSGKIYIGQSADMKGRIKKYKYAGCKKQRKLYNSLIKYGFDAHQFDIIEYCSKEDLNCSERFWQDEFDVLSKNGLNCKLQECGENQYVMSKESIERAVKANTGRKATPEARLNMSLSRINSNTYNSLKVVNKKTKSIYNSITQASRCEGIDRNMLSNYLNGKYKNKTDLEYLDEDKRPVNKEFINTYLITLDLNTGVFYYSINDALKVVNVCRSNFLKMIHGQRQNTTSLIRV